MVEVTVSFTSGARGNKKQQSCIGIAGAGLPSAYFYAEGTLTIQNRGSDGVWVRCDSFYCNQWHMSNAEPSGAWGTDDWTLQGLFASKSAFTLTIDSSGQHAAGVNLIDPVHMSHDYSQSASDHTVWSDAITSKGFQKVADSAAELPHSEDGKVMWLYLAGGITFSQSVTDPVEVNAAEVSMTGGDIPVLFDYIPCAIKAGSAWKSCNREGGTLQLKSGGSWKVERNAADEGGTSTVFVKKDGNWVKAAKVGEE